MELPVNRHYLPPQTSPPIVGDGVGAPTTDGVGFVGLGGVRELEVSECTGPRMGRTGEGAEVVQVREDELKSETEVDRLVRSALSYTPPPFASLPINDDLDTV